MLTFRVGRFLAVLAVGMVSLSVHAQWWNQRVAQAGLPAGPLSPQVWQFGIGPYQLYRIETGSYTKLDKATGRFAVTPNLMGGFSPLVPANQVVPSRSSTGAAMRVPASVPVPGKAVSVPVDIIQDIPTNRLARIVTKGIKALPAVGTVLTIAELLDEAELRFRDGQFYEVTPSGPVVQQVSPSVDPVVWVNEYGTPGTVYIRDGIAYVKAPSRVHGCSGGLGSPWEIVNYKQDRSLPCWFWATYRMAKFVPPAPVQTPISPDEAAERIASKVAVGALIDAVNSLPDDPNIIDVMAREIQDAPGLPRFRLPSPLGLRPPQSITVGDPHVTTTQNPDGSTTVTRREVVATINDDRIDWQRKTMTERLGPDGTVIDTTTTTETLSSPSTPANPTPDPSGTSQLQPVEHKTCGLPDTPPCKIDETGTPRAPDDDGNDVFRSLLPECLREDWMSCIPELPDVNWSFRLPSGCAPIPVPFERYGFSNVDICPYQPMIHDLMSMLWAGAGLFAAIGILSGRRVTED